MKKTSNNKLIFKRIFIFIIALCLFACSKNDNQADPNGDTEVSEEIRPTVIQFTESVNVLGTFVKASEMVGSDVLTTLSSENSKTLFVPTNDAFNAFLSELDEFETLSDFDQASELALLSEILKYHILNTSTYSTELTHGKTFETVQSEEIMVAVDTNVYLQDKTDKKTEVLRADNETRNGVVHIVDKVLLPQAALELLFPKPSLLELVTETNGLNLFKEAIEKAEMEDILKSEEPITVFAPSNEATQILFDLLGDDFSTFDDFDNAVEIQILKEILWGHIVEGDIASEDFVAGKLDTSLPGDYIELVSIGETFEIKDATEVNTKFLSLDYEASNGRFHIIDKILIPHKIKDFVE